MKTIKKVFKMFGRLLSTQDLDQQKFEELERKKTIKNENYYI